MKPRTDKSDAPYSEIPRVIFTSEDITIRESGNVDLGFILECWSSVGDPVNTKNDIIIGLKVLNDIRDLNDYAGTHPDEDVSEKLLYIITQDGVLID